MKAARRDWWLARLARAGVVFLSFVAALGTGYGGVALMVVRASRRFTFESLSLLTAAAAGALPLLAALLTALCVRDWLLRRRLRLVINERARCLGCGYSLLGLAVPPDLVVRCPECDAPTEVDPALAELQDGSAGKEFRPTIKVGPRTLSPTERKRRRRTIVAVVVLLSAVVLTPFGIWGWYELTLRIDSARAAAARPGVAGMQSVVDRVLKARAGPNLGVSAWEEMAKADALITAVNGEVWDKPGIPNNSQNRAVGPEYGLVGEPVMESNPQGAERIAAGVTLAEQMIPKLRERGVFEHMRAMRDAGDLTPPFMATLSEPLINVLLPELGRCRVMGRINKARAMLALRSGDPAEFGDALENLYALARMCEREPLAISRQVSLLLESMGDGLAKRALMTRPEKAWIDVVERAMERRDSKVLFAQTLEGERVALMDTVCAYYEDQTFKGRLQMQLANVGKGDSAAVRDGRFHEAVAQVNAAFDAAVADAALDPHMRQVRSAPPESDIWIVRKLIPKVSTHQRGIDHAEADRRGLRLMIALERHRTAKGGYPAALQTLAPEFIDAVPIDPWTGKPFCYRLLDPSADAGKRPYLLYACGLDRTDDGGAAEASPANPVARATMTGLDYIINEEKFIK